MSWNANNNNNASGIPLTNLPGYDVIAREKDPNSYVSYVRKTTLDDATSYASIGKEHRRPQFFSVNHVETIYPPSFFEKEYLPKEPGCRPSKVLKDNAILNLSRVVSGDLHPKILEKNDKCLEYYRDMVFMRGRTLDGGRPVYAFLDYDFRDYGPRIYLEAREGFENATYVEETQVTDNVSRYRDSKATISSLCSSSNGVSGHCRFVRWLQNYMFSKICNLNCNGKYKNRDRIGSGYSSNAEGEGDEEGEEGGERKWTPSTIVEPWMIKSFVLHRNRKGIKTLYGHVPEPERGGPDRHVIQIDLTSCSAAKKLHHFFESEAYLNLAAAGVVPTIRSFETEVEFDSRWRQEFDIQFSNFYQTCNYEFMTKIQIEETFLDSSYVCKGSVFHAPDEDERNCGSPLYIVLKGEKSLSRLRDEDFVEYLKTEGPSSDPRISRAYAEVVKGTAKIPQKTKDCTSSPFTACKPLICAFDIETNSKVDILSGKTLFSVGKWTPQVYADRYKFLISAASKARLSRMAFYKAEEARELLAQLIVKDSLGFLRKRLAKEMHAKVASMASSRSSSVDERRGEREKTESEEKILEKIMLDSILPRPSEMDECTVICFVFRKNETGTELFCKNGAYCYTWLPQDGEREAVPIPSFDNITKSDHGYFANAKCTVFPDELSMIEAFVRTVRENHAEIYVGHHNMEFDMSYLLERVSVLKENKAQKEASSSGRWSKRGDVSLPHFSFGALVGRKDSHRHYSFVRNKGLKTTHDIKSSGITIMDTVHCVRNDNFGKKAFGMPFSLACLMFRLLKYPGGDDVLRKLEVDITKCRLMWQKGGFHLSYLVGYCLFDAVGSAMIAEMENYLEVMYIVADVTSTPPSQVFIKGAQNIVNHYVHKMTWQFDKIYIIPNYGTRELHWPDLWYDHIYVRKIADPRPIDLPPKYVYKDVRELYETSPILKRKWENGCIREIPDYRNLPKNAALALNPFFPHYVDDSADGQSKKGPMTSDLFDEIVKKHVEAYKKEKEEKKKNVETRPPTPRKKKKCDVAPGQTTIEKYFVSYPSTEEKVFQSVPPEAVEKKISEDRKNEKAEKKEPTEIIDRSHFGLKRYVYDEEEKKARQKDGTLAKTKGYMGGNVLPTYRGFFFENLEKIEDFVSQYPTIVCDYSLDFCNMVTENMKVAFSVPGYHLTRMILGPEHLTHMGNVFESKPHAKSLGYGSPHLAYVYYYQNVTTEDCVLINIIKVLLAFRAESKRRKAYWFDKMGKLTCIHTVYKKMLDSNSPSSLSEVTEFFRDQVLREKKANDYGGEEFLNRVMDAIASARDSEGLLDCLYKFVDATTAADKKYDPLVLDAEAITAEYGGTKESNGRRETAHKAMEKKLLLLVLKSQKEYKNADTEQNSIKLIMNSHYGVISATKSKLPNQTLGSGITAKGRLHSDTSANVSENLDLIELAGMEGSGENGETALVMLQKKGINLLEQRVEGTKLREKVIAGDTDSVMVLIPAAIKNTRVNAQLYKNTLGKMGIRIINNLLPKVPKSLPAPSEKKERRGPIVLRDDRKSGEICMELEKIHIRELKIRMKNYVCDPLEDTKLTLKGVSAKKSDTLLFAANLEKKLYAIIFRDDDGKTTAKEKIETAIVRARTEIVNILDGRYDPVDFIMVTKMDKPVEAYEKTAGTGKLPKHVLVAKMKLKRNEKVVPGDSIRYVYVENGESTYVDNKYLVSAISAMNPEGDLAAAADDGNGSARTAERDAARFANYVTTINNKALRDGIVAEDADYAFSQGLPLDMLYYIQIKLLKELSKFFAPFLCNILGWKVPKYGDKGGTSSAKLNKLQKKEQTADEKTMYDILTQGDIKMRMQMLTILRLQRQLIRYSFRENKMYMPKSMIRRCVKCNALFCSDSGNGSVSHSSRVKFLDEKRDADGFYSICENCKKTYKSVEDLKDEYRKDMTEAKKAFRECDNLCLKCIDNCGVAKLTEEQSRQHGNSKYYTKPQDCTLSYCPVFRQKKFIRSKMNRSQQDYRVLEDMNW